MNNSSPVGAVVHITKRWTAHAADPPLAGTRVHLLLVPSHRADAVDILDLDEDTRDDFWHMLARLRDRYDLDAYGLAMDDGLPVHVVAGDGTTKVLFTFNGRPAMSTDTTAERLPGEAPPALDAAQVDALIADHTSRPAEHADRFVRPPTPLEVRDAEATVLAWFRANGVVEALPSPLTVSVGTDGMMLYTAFRWKAGDRTTQDNVATRGGIAVVEPCYHTLTAPLTMAVEAAMVTAGVTVHRHTVCPTPNYLDDEPPVAAVPGGRPAMNALYAEIADTWLALNGIDEWLPERARFDVDGDTITYDGYVYAGARTWDGEVYTWAQAQLEPDDGRPYDPDTVAVVRVTVPLATPVTDRIRDLFRASALALTERVA